MKSWIACVVVGLAATPAFGQPYEIAWRTVDGGGSMGVAGGPYVLDSTAGQPDAGAPASGGPYALSGGFWPVGLPSIPAADLSLGVSDAPDPVVGLQPLTYTLTVTNSGPAAATDVVLASVLPATVAFQSAGGSGWICGEAGGTVTCTRASLPLGAAPNVTITVTAPPAAQTLTSTATVAAVENDPVSANNSDTEATTVAAAPTADLRIVKSDGGVVVTWGQPLTYTIAASNSGPAPVTGALVTDAFPPSLSGVAWTCSATGGSSCPASGNGNVNHVVNLLAGGVATFTATGVVVPGTYAPIVNTATIGVPTGVFDPVAANNTSQETTPVVSPDLIFEDDFDTRDLDAWSSSTGQGLSVVPNAAYSGFLGLQVRLGGTAPQFVQDDSPIAETRYRARFYVRLERLRMDAADELELFRAVSPTAQVKVRLLLAPGAGPHTLRMAAVLDDGSVVQTPAGSEAALPLGWHSVEIDWQAASAPGAHDGRLDLWVDGQPQPSLQGLDTDEARIGMVRWGAVSGLDAGTSGTFALDAFISRRHTMIGPLSSFADVPSSHPFWPHVQAVRNAEVMDGCGGGNFCPDAVIDRGQMGGHPVTRAEMAAFLALTMGLALPVP